MPDSFQHSIENFFSYKLLDNHYIFITKQSACRQDRNGRHDERVNFSRCNGESHSKIMAQFLFSLCQRHPSLKKNYWRDRLCDSVDNRVPCIHYPGNKPFQCYNSWSDTQRQLRNLLSVCDLFMKQLMPFQWHK